MKKKKNIFKKLFGKAVFKRIWLMSLPYGEVERGNTVKKEDCWPLILFMIIVLCSGFLFNYIKNMIKMYMQ